MYMADSLISRTIVCSTVGLQIVLYANAMKIKAFLFYSFSKPPSQPHQTTIHHPTPQVRQCVCVCVCDCVCVCVILKGFFTTEL